MKDEACVDCAFVSRWQDGALPIKTTKELLIRRPLSVHITQLNAQFLWCKYLCVGHRRVSSNSIKSEMESFLCIDGDDAVCRSVVPTLTHH